MKRFLTILFLTIAASTFALQSPMASYVITSEVGYRINPMGGAEESFHRGLDMVGPHNAQVLAAADGKVVEHWLVPGTVQNGKVFKGHPTFGGMILIDHGNGIWTLYGHLSKTFIHTGNMVTAGQVIGLQGDTGQATGEHLHFEVIIDPRLMFEVNETRPTSLSPRRWETR